MSGLTVVRPGLLTSVQDLGRWGAQGLGVPVGGPMDVYAHRLANVLVDNDADAATLEITLIGPELHCERDVVVAITGAVFDVFLDEAVAPLGLTFRARAGQRLRFGRRRVGARAYLAVAGGIAVPPVAGSRATNVAAGMGGHDGRALKAGDRLPVGEPGPGASRERRGAGFTLPAGKAVVRVMPGPQEDQFSPGALETLCREVFRVSPRSNRMGYRLEGPPIGVVPDLPEPISEPVPMGAIQVPPAGDVILLMADRQTHGGYAKLATAISADLWLAGQLAPGDQLSFRACARDEAWSALVQRERQLLHVVERGPLP
ncbi:MAG: biotin-dependent carboxyltransferase family protein [Vicinamibacteria bacterium]